MRRAMWGWVVIFLVMQLLLSGCRQPGEATPVPVTMSVPPEATSQAAQTAGATSGEATDNPEPSDEKPEKPASQTATASPDAAEPGATPDPALDAWTVLVYMSTSDALDTSALALLNDFETVGSSEEVNIVVQLDRNGAVGESEGWSGARRYYVMKDSDGASIGSELQDELGSVNMGDPDTLTEFIRWAQESYAANHYALMVWGESRSWRGMARDAGDDDDLSMSDLGGAIERALSQSNSPTLDVVLLDGHMTASVEVLNAIQPFATYAVGAPAVFAGSEPDYGELFEALVSGEDVTPRQFAEYALAAGQGASSTALPAVVAFDLREMPAINDALHALSEYLVQNAELTATTMARAHSTTRIATPSFAGSDELLAAVDLWQFAQYLARFAPQKELARRGEALAVALESAILSEELNEETGPMRSVAMSFLPLGRIDDPVYSDVDAVGWQAALRAFYEASTELAVLTEGALAIQGSETAGAQQPILLGVELRTTNVAGAGLVTLSQEAEEDYRLLSIQPLRDNASPRNGAGHWLAGVHQQEIVWDSMAPYLSDGANGDFTPLWPVPGDQSLVMAPVRYIPVADESGARDAVLLLDEAGQTLSGVWQVGDEENGPQQLLPASGDSFQIYNVHLGTGEGLTYTPGATLVYSDGVEIGFDYFPLPSGAYQLGSLAQGTSGYSLAARAEVAVVNEALLPGYQVYLNGDYGFSFLYPVGWPAPVFDGRRVATAARQRGPTLTVSMHSQSGSASAVQLKAETLEAFGELDVLYEETVSIAEEEGLLTAYGYNAADGPHTGVFITFVDRNRNTGYVVDVDGLALDEDNTLETARQLVASWRFVPVRSGVWPEQWVTTDLGSLTVTLPSVFGHSTLENGWELFRDGASFIAVRRDEISGEGQPAIAEHWAEVASRGVEEFVADAPQSYALGESVWSRLEFRYASEDGPVGGLILATVYDGVEIVAWVEAPLDAVGELLEATFLPTLAGLLPAAPGSAGVLYETTFEEAGTWGTGRQDGATAAVSDGAYTLEVEAPRGFFWTAAGESLAAAQYEVDVMQTDGSLHAGYGLLFGVQDEAQSFYLFEISSDGYLWIGACQNNCAEATTLVGDGWFESDAVRRGRDVVNHLRVQTGEEMWTFYVNDRVVATVEGEVFESGDMGLFAETFGEDGVAVQFDNVRVISP